MSRSSMVIKGKKGMTLREKFWDQRYLMILVLPVVLWMIIFNYIPMLGLIISFKSMILTLDLLKALLKAGG